MRYFRLNCTGLAALLFAFAMVYIGNSVIAAEFYMFKDKAGHTQIQDSIPSEYIKNGYKMVNERGMTIKVVPSEREQRKNLAESLRKQHADSLMEQRLAEEHERDERLFQSFSSAEEIREAGNKKILIVQTQIETTAKHIKAFENNLAKLEEQFAAGGNANDESIQELRESVKQNYAFISRKRQEQNHIREEYIGYIKRYEMLDAR